MNWTITQEWHIVSQMQNQLRGTGKVRASLFGRASAACLGTIIFLFSAVGLGADFQKAKLLDVQAFKEAGASIIAPNNGYPVVIPTSHNMFTITVAIGDMGYSAQYRQQRHFKPSELVVGDVIDAKVDGDKLVLRTAENKEVKARIVRRQRLSGN
jgi:hypothetical protein